MPFNCKEGDILEVFINEGKMVERCLVPHESVPSSIMETSVGYLELPNLQLDRSMFMRPYFNRLCIVLGVEPRSPPTELVRPRITIVLITTFYGQPLHEFIASDRLCWVMPLGSSDSITDSFDTSPPWVRLTTGSIPAYVLCIPIKVSPCHLQRPDSRISIEANNLQKLKSYVSSLGSIRALKLLGDDDYDNGNDLFFMESRDRVFGWHEIEQDVYLD